MVPKFFGSVQFGRLTLDDQDAYEAYLCTLSGEVELLVQKKRDRRSLKQNQYYWGVVIRMIADETGHTSEEIHELMKQMFLKGVIHIKGEAYETVQSTTDLDTFEFSQDYLERIRYWAFDKLGVVIPDPEQI